MTIWTEERVAQLLSLFRQGLKAAEIAAKMGCFEGYQENGRLAVTGKLGRMGLYFTQPNLNKRTLETGTPLEVREPWNPARDPKPDRVRA